MLHLISPVAHRHRHSKRAQREEVLGRARVSKPPRSKQEPYSGVRQGTLLRVRQRPPTQHTQHSLTELKFDIIKYLHQIDVEYKKKKR